MNRPHEPVIVVGAGLAGLCCARRLSEEDVEVLVLEGADEVGGRVRTDEVDGFRLDRGFQVLQTAYPEARRVLDYDALDLRPFEPTHSGVQFFKGDLRDFPESGFDCVIALSTVEHVGLGAYYRVAETWLLMVGWAYDSSPISKSKDRSPILPVDRQFRYAAGVQYDWSKDFTVGAAYTLIDAGDSKINKEGTPLTG